MADALREWCGVGDWGEGTMTGERVYMDEREGEGEGVETDL